MKCEHKYNYVKEVKVPTGRYLVETKEAFVYKEIEYIPVDQNYLREEMVDAGLSICEKCGDIQIRVLNPTTKKGKQ